MAAGRFDGYVEHDLRPWDMAAGMLLVREAGGHVTDVDGGQRMFETGSIVAGNPGGAQGAAGDPGGDAREPAAAKRRAVA